MAKFVGKRKKAEIPSLLAGAEIPQDVIAFSKKEKILDQLFHSVELVEKHFKGVSDFNFDVVQDPENPEDEWVSVYFKTKGDVEETVASFDKYTTDWVKRVPWPKRIKILLDYDIE